MDIIAQLHASLLLRSLLRMAVGELTKRAALWTAFWSVCVCASCQTTSVYVCGGCCCFVPMPALIVCACVCVLMWPVVCVWMCSWVFTSICMWCIRVCVHACRMTFTEMWQWEKKHLTHNWSAMKEIWTRICIGLTCSGLTRGRSMRQHAKPVLWLSYHPEGWLQCSKWYLGKKNDRGKHTVFKVSNPDDKIDRPWLCDLHQKESLRWMQFLWFSIWMSWRIKQSPSCS